MDRIIFYVVAINFMAYTCDKLDDIDERLEDLHPVTCEDRKDWFECVKERQAKKEAAKENWKWKPANGSAD